MILFNCTKVPIYKIVDDNIINVRRIDISICNKMLEDIDLLATTKDILEPLLIQEDRILITFYGLDEALENNKSYDMGDLTYKSFKGLLNTFITSGHEVVLYTDKVNIDPDIKEMANTMEGVEIISDQVNLVEYCKTNIL